MNNIISRSCSDGKMESNCNPYSQPNEPRCFFIHSQVILFVYNVELVFYSTFFSFFVVIFNGIVSNGWFIRNDLNVPDILKIGINN